MGNKSKIMNFSIKKEITFTELMQLMTAKAFYIILCGLICATVFGVSVKLLVTPVYRSYTSLYVHNDASTINNEGKTVTSSDLLAAESLANTYVNILQRNVVLDAVTEEYRRNSIYTNNSVDRNAIESMLSVTIVDGTQLIEVSIESTDKNVAYDVAEAYMVVASKKLEDITQAGGVHIVDKPELGVEPVSPKPLINALIGFLCGIIFSVFFFLIKTLSDNTIYLAEDVISITDIPVFGVVPDIKTEDVTKPKWYLEKATVVTAREVFGDE